ncbi:MAG: cytochrome b N-terminal domain-containing protein [Anaerolineales bacterium]|jgi:quinol-cytochrome oxidoreductase complex cytochrome b subunit
MRPNFFQHIHPPTIPAEQARWRYTLGAGGTAVFLVLVLVFSGMLEMFFYIPSPSEAALSIQTLSYVVPFGGLVRNIHFWAAQLLVVVMTIHLVRVVLTGSYAPPRRFNYLLGLSLFVIAMLLDFTGYVLRWDTGIQWALVVGTNLLKSIPWIGDFLYRMLVGGSYPGSATLIRFFSWHVYGLILLAVVLIIWHLFRVRRDGGIAVPPPKLRTEKRRISRADLARLEVNAMLLCGSALILFSAVFPAPIAPAITEVTALSGEASAPWFFLWIQQMLKWGNPFLWGVLVPLLILAVIALIPFVFPQTTPQDLGRWLPPSNRLAQVVMAGIVLLILLLTLLGLRPIS